VVAAELRADGLATRVPVGVARSDLADAFPGLPGADRAGFRATVSVLGTPPEFSFVVDAVLDDRTRVELGTVRGRHRWRQSRSPAFADLVSVVIPCYRQAHFLGEGIESVLAQSYPHLEILVVDDGSSDNVGEVAARYPGVRYVRRPNGGLSAARNTGLQHTNGDYVVFLDADDRLLPGAIETGLRHLREHPECAFTAGRYRGIDQDGSPVPAPDQPAVTSDHYRRLLITNWAHFTGVAIYRRAVFEEVTGFDPAFAAAEDYELNLRIASRFPVCGHGDVVAEHRAHGGSLSGDAGKMLRFTLAGLRRQRGRAQSDPELRRAYRQGMRFWRGYYGAELRQQLRASLRERSYGRALREASLLVRHRALGRRPGPPSG
jgi:glycosyltransferase involved in cell wall biosynthesis